MSAQRITPTSVRSVILVAAVAGTAAWSLLRILDSRSIDMLTAAWLGIPWTLPVGLALVALGLAVSARAWSLRLAGAAGAKPVDPLAAARTVAAAKASALVGSLVGGLYAGYALFLLPDSQSALRTSRLWASGATFVAAVLVVVAALLLERVLRLPHGDEDATDRG